MYNLEDAQKWISIAERDYAVEARYVENNQDYTEDTAEFALKHAKQILDKAKETLNLTKVDIT